MSYLKKDQPTLPSKARIADTDLRLLALEPDDNTWLDRFLRRLRQLHCRSEYFWAGLRRQLQQLVCRWMPPSLLRGWSRPALWTVSALLAANVVAHPLIALAQNPVGSEFRVNAYTTDRQTNPSVAMDADGDFVVAWRSYNQAGSSSYSDIYAQRYGSDGSPQGSEFLVNTYTTSNQSSPSVAIDADGDFVVAWGGYGPGGSGYDIYARRYSQDGTPQDTTEFLVNTYTTSSQSNPNVAMDADGDFAVAWESHNQTGGDYGDIYAQRYNAAGVAQGGEFRVNTYTTNYQRNPSVAMDADGDFVVAWDSAGQDGSSHEIYAMRYSQNGTSQGPEFRVNTHTTDSQYSPSVAMDAGGNFVVAWESNNQVDATSRDDIYAQQYSSDGSVQGLEFLVNTYTTNDQGTPRVAMDAGGDFVVTWESTGQDGDDGGTANYEENVYAQRYDSAGVAQGSEFRVNTYTESDQLSSAVAARDAAGDFVVAWHSVGQDGDGAFDANIYAQRYGRSLYLPLIVKGS